MLGGQLTLPGRVWNNLNRSWIVFFVVAGAANLYFAMDYLDSETALRAAVPAISESDIEKFNCDAALYQPDYKALCQSTEDKEAFWVNFKLFGLLGFTIIFIIGQSLYLARYIKDESEDTATDNSTSPANKTEPQE